MHHVFHLFCLIASLAVSMGSLAAETVDLPTVHDGLERECLAYVPQTLIDHPETPRRLLLVLHGGTQNGPGIYRSWGSGYTEVANDLNLVVCYPSGIDGWWNDDRPEHPTHPQIENVDDVGYLTSLMDLAAERFGTDPDSVFISGASNGGMMCYRLMRECGERLAASAPIVGLIPTVTPIEEFTVPVPMLMMAGTADPNIPYHGGYTTNPLDGSTDIVEVYSAAETMAIFAEAYGLPGTYRTTFLPNSDPTDGTITQRQFFTGSRPGNALMHYRIINGGHAIPGTGGQDCSQDFSAAEHIGKFFATFAKTAAVNADG